MSVLDEDLGQRLAVHDKGEVRVPRIGGQEPVAGAVCEYAVRKCLANMSAMGASASLFQDVELRLDRRHVRLVDADELHLVGEELTGVANVDGRLLLVTSEDPDFDAAGCQVGDAPRHALLQLVFDGRGANDLQVHLHLFGHLGQVLGPVLRARRSAVIRPATLTTP